MVNQKINISLEVSPENALLLSVLIQNGVYGQQQSLEKLLSANAKQDLMSIGQEIINQIVAKTDFDLLRIKNDLLGGIEQN
jgi:hypothetical protein